MLTFLSCCRRPIGRFLTVAGTMAGALLVLVVAVWFIEKSPAQAGALVGQPGGQQATAVAAERNGRGTAIERRLTVCRERISAIGPPLLAQIADRSRRSNDLMNQAIAAKKAEANFKNAQLTLEVAEIGIVEYREGTAKIEEATIEGELKLAESELLRAQDRIAFSKSLSAKIKELSKGTDDEVALVKSYEDKFPEALKREPYAKSAVNRAQAKLRLLRDHTIPTQIKKLESGVLMARADELTKKAVWEREKSKESRLEAQISNLARKAPGDEMRKAFTRAFGLEEKIRAELEMITKDKALDPGLGKTATDLLSELESVIDQTEAEVARVRVDRLKAALSAGAVRTDAAVQTAVTAELARFVGGMRHRLKECHRRIARLGEPLLESIRLKQTEEADPTGLATRIEGAEAAMKSAVLARESAEAELSTYRELAFPQSLAACEEDLARAKEDLTAATKNRVAWDERFEQNKNLPVESASSLVRQYDLEARRLIAELEEKKAGFAIEQAESKLKILKEYEKEKRTKELQAEIERSRSDELRAKAEIGQAEAELKRSRRPKPEPSESQKQALALLEQAFAFDETIQGKLAQLAKNGKIDAGLQKEIADSTNQLEATLDRAEADSAIARFDALKQQFGRGAR
jgi:hypothetical protein